MFYYLVVGQPAESDVKVEHHALLEGGSAVGGDGEAGLPELDPHEEPEVLGQLVHQVRLLLLHHGHGFVVNLVQLGTLNQPLAKLLLQTDEELVVLLQN